MPMPFRRRQSSRSGFTLLEVLVATAITLLMMLALAKIFKDIGQGMKQGRAALELNSRLRDVCFRIQRDMNNLTARPGALPGTSSGTGYFEYYDGSHTDYTAKMLVEGSNAVPGVSRIGDVDDILMATVRAGDIWFTGKVPLFILEGRAPTSTADLEDQNAVSIAAQHAEVAFFMQPVVASEKQGFTYLNVQRDPSYLVANQAFFQDNEGDGIPDAYRLHYRTLLIRPDLNYVGTAFPGTLPRGPAANPYFTAGASSSPFTLPDGSTASLPSPQCDMYRVHGVCDLSLRRVFDGASGVDSVAANSLQDLENPANRFAHIQVDGLPATASTSMPILALGPSMPIHTSDPLYYDFSQSGPPTLAGGGLAGAGFLHPAYTLLGSRVGEDILANNVLAFDVKGYDPGVSILNSLGLDGGSGVVNVDDDGNGTMDDATEIGWAGSDDLVLDPNDPGYGPLLALRPLPVAGVGQYVDLGWARKIDAHGLLPAGARVPTANPWSPLSGYALNQISNTNLQLGVAPSLLSSGKVLNRSNGSSLIYQPSYDTWTPEFERDGILQAQTGSMAGVVRIDGNRVLHGAGGASNISQAQPAWRRTNFDAATDGLDNDGFRGADDILERETSAPFPVPLRGIKILVRMEDPGTRKVAELPVAVEFVSQ